MLALELKKTVGELLATIDSAEITEWMAYYSITPFGDVRRDLQHGMTATTIANVNIGENQTPFNPVDFLLFPDKPERTHEEMERDLQDYLSSRA